MLVDVWEDHSAVEDGRPVSEMHREAILEDWSKQLMTCGVILHNIIQCDLILHSIILGDVWTCDSQAQRAEGNTS